MVLEMAVKNQCQVILQEEKLNLVAVVHQSLVYLQVTACYVIQGKHVLFLTQVKS